jgi:hypothetical protein
MCLGAAGARLDVEKAVIGVHLLREHAAEFHVLDDAGQFGGVAFDGDQRVIVVFGTAHFEEFARVGQVAIQIAQRNDNAFKGFAFAADFLGASGVTPQRRIFAEFYEFFETAGLGIVVKDTSATPPYAPGDPAGDWRWR